MCGIVGIIESPMQNNIKENLIQGLTYLQHRGQDSAGIALTTADGKIHIHKDIGLVSQVFSREPLEGFNEHTYLMGIGHVRYSTQGSINLDEAQPLYSNSPYGIALSHNGNLTNTEELVTYLIKKQRHINTNSDSEILLNVFAAELADSPTDVFGAVSNVMKLLKGSYSVVMTIDGIGLVAFRDPRGIRPLCYGISDTNGYMFVSESVALTGSPYQLERDVLPGECIVVDEYRNVISDIVGDTPLLTPCLFEYIYFARPDSIIDGISVYKARERLGTFLAFALCDYAGTTIKLDIDVVIPVPDTSRTYAIKMAEVLDVPYREAFVKNRYIARTFIMSDQSNQHNRTKMVKMKLNTIDSEFLNKNVLIVDDSIVRGTTSKELVRLAKQAGAKNVWFASAAPPIRNANRLGIDIPTCEELIAFNRSEREIALELGCEKVFYNNLEEICDGIRELAPNMIDGFETSCFQG
jgi:amidophosphoribosyltransferase